VSPSLSLLQQSHPFPNPTQSPLVSPSLSLLQLQQSYLLSKLDLNLQQLTSSSETFLLLPQWKVVLSSHR
jgi:hypothetical protein